MSLIEHVDAALALATLPGERLMVAVSGGSDSIGLLASLMPAAASRLVVGHVDHAVRKASAAGATFVASLAEDHDLPFALSTLPAAGPASETTLRRLRWEALTDLARRHGCAWVLAAHHADDAFETALLHLLRGHRGARALAGPPTARALAPGIGLLRPVLHGIAPPSRADLAEARRAAGWPHIEDSSNQDTSIPRNRVRALLAEDRAPLDRTRLLGVRQVARAQLQQDLSRAVAALTADLSIHGRGAALGPRAIAALCGSPGVAVETLRLLGGCLAHPTALIARRTILERLADGAGRSRGELILPGHPREVRLALGRDQWSLPEEGLAPGDRAARVLASLGRTSLHL